MYYQDCLQTISSCPFCAIPHNFVIEDGIYSKVILNRGPYGPDHLLIIPQRHVVYFHDLLPEEHYEIYAFLIKYNRLMYQLGHTDTAILLRDGPIKKPKDDKSLEHLHWHIIPERNIGDLDISAQDSPKREFFDDEKYIAVTTVFKERCIVL